MWGLFDRESFGDSLLLPILRKELGARLPTATITAFAPFGSRRPTGHDGGDPADPLGLWSPEAAAELASTLDCIILTGVDLPPDHGQLATAYGVDRAAIDALDPGRWFVDGPGPEIEERCPLVWQAVTISSDFAPSDAERLRAPSPGRSRFEADPSVLAPRLFSPDLLAKRLDYLWLMGWYPSEGAAVVVEGDAHTLPLVPGLGATLSEFLTSEPDLKVVIAELGSPGDDQFASALAGVLPSGSTYRLPRCAGLEDVTTAIANCAIFAGASSRAGLVAEAFGRARLTLDPSVPLTVEDFEQARRADLPPGGDLAVVAQADAELDRIAEIAIAATLARTRKEALMPDTERLEEVEASLGNLQVAHEARSRRLATERMVFANHLHKAEAEIARLKDETARLREELARADGRTLDAEARTHAEAAARHGLEEELAGLRATRTFRYTAELRSVYGRLRQMGDRPQADSPENPPRNGR